MKRSNLFFLHLHFGSLERLYPHPRDRKFVSIFRTRWAYEPHSGSWNGVAQRASGRACALTSRGPAEGKRECRGAAGPAGSFCGPSRPQEPVSGNTLLAVQAPRAAAGLSRPTPPRPAPLLRTAACPRGALRPRVGSLHRGRTCKHPAAAATPPPLNPGPPSWGNRKPLDVSPLPAAAPHTLPRVDPFLLLSSSKLALQSLSPLSPGAPALQIHISGGSAKIGAMCLPSLFFLPKGFFPPDSKYVVSFPTPTKCSNALPPLQTDSHKWDAWATHIFA